MSTGNPRRIVFAFPDRNIREFVYERFRIPIITEPREGLVVAESWDAGPLIYMMMWTAIGSAVDLRKVFNNYTCSQYASDACNWLEIDYLANLLCVRWSRQPEACVNVDDDGVKT